MEKWAIRFSMGEYPLELLPPDAPPTEEEWKTLLPWIAGAVVEMGKKLREMRETAKEQSND